MLRPASVRRGRRSIGGWTDAGPAMAANVEEGVHAASGIAGDDDTLAGNFAKNVVAWSWNFGFAARVDPHLRVEAVHFFAEDLRVRVVAPWKSPWRGRHFCLHIFPEGVRFSRLLCHKPNWG